ncbi:MAG: UvrD-helicase domain-containing protein [Chloroflexi bacterium]|nr:UvrD-helicase domain-containing protein [Chloroflexota bacterium]MBP7045972.1 UvrD-helicase domain-containing protein [Chloroflexota bacterium]
MSDYLQGLNAQQKTAVTAPAGPVLVLAGPGSGKTRVLTQRIVYLMQELRVPPWHILAVTFTNKAAKEMTHRLENMLETPPRGLTMGTFHAVCARILRRETENLTYYGRDFVIFDTTDQLQVVKQVLKELNLDDKKFPPAKLLNGISSAKNELITPDIYSATNYIAEVTKRVYERYQVTLQANNAMDFDDLLMNTALLFDERPDVLQTYQARYQHILVDEFQDTNTTQYVLIQRLAAAHRHIFAVGDSDQSIYKWRGADFRNIQRFQQAYPDAQVVLLEQNYRSTQTILDAAKAVIRHNTQRVHKELFTERQGGDLIVIGEAYNDLEEGDIVISTIQSLLLDGYSPGDIAVMYRTNAQSRVLEEAFVRASMPYRLVGATQFYKRREVKDVIAYLRLVHNTADSVSFNRIINVPTRGIGAKTLQQLQDWAALNGWQPGDAVLEIATNPVAQHPFRARALTALQEFGNMLFAWITLRESATVGDLFDLVLEQTHYREFIDDGTDEGRDRWENVMELRSVAGDATLSLSDFLEQVALVSETDNVEDEPNSTTLLTLHAAKGLEFPVVFITGLEEGMLPHSRSMEDAEELAEERRLFYVGITRAKDRLYLSHAFRRSTYGEPEAATPSRFLLDIPEELTSGGRPKARRKESVSRASSWSQTTPSWSWNQSSEPKRGSTTGHSSTKQPSRQTNNWSTPSRPTPSRPTPGRPTPSSTTPERAPLPKPNHLTQPAEPQRAAPISAGYKTGQTVRHAKFGEGIVIESKLTGNDEEVSVAFKEFGIKRLAASFAKLEIIGE